MVNGSPPSGHFRYGAIKGALRERIAPAGLHHQPGHDLAVTPRAIGGKDRCYPRDDPKTSHHRGGAQGQNDRSCDSHEVSAGTIDSRGARWPGCENASKHDPTPEVAYPFDYSCESHFYEGSRFARTVTPPHWDFISCYQSRRRLPGWGRAWKRFHSVGGEMADIHVVDHPLAKRANTSFGHGEAPV
jgi:hypothetical protein